jgi:hypothetical protein
MSKFMSEVGDLVFLSDRTRVRRPVLNVEALDWWGVDQGVNVLPPLYAIVLDVPGKVDAEPAETDTVIVAAGGKDRKLVATPDGMIALQFSSPDLEMRNAALQDAGAEEHPYRPHIPLLPPMVAGAVPYSGEIVLGPEEIG